MTYLDTEREPAEHWNKIKQYALNHAPVCLGLEIHLQKGKGDQEKLSQICLQGNLHSAAKLPKSISEGFRGIKKVLFQRHIVKSTNPL